MTDKQMADLQKGSAICFVMYQENENIRKSFECKNKIFDG